MRECSQGDGWEVPLSRVKRGTWCPRCANKSISIEEMRRMAAERGGACLSTDYINMTTPLEWRCARNHVWTVSPKHIRDRWCPVCGRSRRLELSELKKIARRRGGRLLSRRDVNARTPLTWTCAEGHVWETTAA